MVIFHSYVSLPEGNCWLSLYYTILLLYYTKLYYTILLWWVIHESRMTFRVYKLFLEGSSQLWGGLDPPQYDTTYRSNRSMFYCIKSERQKIRGKQAPGFLKQLKKHFLKLHRITMSYHPITFIYISFWGVLRSSRISLSPSISVSQSLEECDSRMPLGTAATGTWDSHGLAWTRQRLGEVAWTYWDWFMDYPPVN